MPRTRHALLLAVCLATAPAVGTAAVNDLWVAESHGTLLLSSATGDLELEITGLTRLRAVEVDLVGESLWVFEDEDLHRFDFTGQRVATIGLEGVSSSAHVAMAVDPAAGLTWVGIGNQLRAVDAASGALVVSSTLPDGVVDIAADPEKGNLWISTQARLLGLDATTGLELWSVALDPGRVGNLSLDLPSGEGWVATGDEVRRYDELGTLLGAYQVPGAQAVAIGETGIWVATTKELLHLDASGTVVFTTEPFDRQGSIGHLVVAGDRSVWTANHQEIAHYSDTGGLLQRLSFNPPIHVWDLAVNEDFHPPTLDLVSPAAGACIPTPTFPFEVAYDDVGWGVDPDSVGITVDGSAVEISCSPTASTATCDLLDPQADGPHTLVASVMDHGENRAETPARNIVVDTVPPQIQIASPPDGFVTGEPELTITGSLSEPAIFTSSGDSVTVGSDLTFSAGPFTLTEGENTFELQAVDCAGNTTTRQLTVVYQPPTDDELPPDPSTVAPEIDPTVATDIADSTEFLYAGPNPIQRDMEPGTIDPRRVAVIRGTVLARGGESLPGVRIQILDQPELGWTLSREDGMFDLVVNGGGSLVVDYQKDGYLRSQRRLDTPWRDFVRVEDVVLVPIDPEVTVISTGAPEVQVARGTLSEDEDGARQSTLVFPSGVSAEMVLPDGTRQPLQSLAVRSTEYTIGPEGPASMPGELPATSGYTYAVELSVDEALAAGATTVEFDRPVYHYVENFLDFPVGGIVPTGYYDREQATWVPSENGRVIKILSITNGLAEIDTTGSGQPANNSELSVLGVTSDELATLAQLYEPGQSLWRVPIPHLTPWDCNWPFGPPDDAEFPPDPDIEKDPTSDDGSDEPGEDIDDSCQRTGSIIECENQALGQSIPVAGTPFSLNYNSSRIGNAGSRTWKLRLTDEVVPVSLRRVELELTVAGKTIYKVFSPASNIVYKFTWDGRDAYGRIHHGFAQATAKVTFIYPGVIYNATPDVLSFAQVSEDYMVLGNREAQEIELVRYARKGLDAGVAHFFGLGGWSLDPHHVYVPNRPALYLGNGSQQRPTPLDDVARTIAGGTKPLPPQVAPGDGGPAVDAGFNAIYDVDVASDRSILLATDARIRRIDRNGFIDTIAGGGSIPPADGIPALDAAFGIVRYVGVAGDGSYFVTAFNSRISRHCLMKVDTQGLLSIVECDMRPLTAFEVLGDGSVVYVDGTARRVWRVTPDGKRRHVAGTIGGQHPWDDRRAQDVDLVFINGLAAGRDGTIYLAEHINSYWYSWSRLWRISPDGRIWRVGGVGPYGAPDGTLALEANIGSVFHLEVDPSERLVFFERAGGAFNPAHMIRVVDHDGRLRTLAGANGDSGVYLSSYQPRKYGIRNNYPDNKFAISPDGTLYFPERWNSTGGVLRSITGVLPSASGVRIPSQDGSQIYAFSRLLNGRHAETLDALTGALLWQFSYDDEGRLVSINDASGNVTRIARLSDKIEIVAPEGQTTTLVLDSNGFLQQVDGPGNRSWKVTYKSNGLLTSVTDPNLHKKTYEYSPLGRLVQASDQVEGSKVLSRRKIDSGHEVTLTTAMGRSTSYQLYEPSIGGRSRQILTASGLISTATQRADGTTVTTTPDGVIVETEVAADPRFGFQAPSLRRQSTTTPSGLTSTVVGQRTVLLAPSFDQPSGVGWLRDDWSVNGRSYSLFYDATTRTSTVTTPTGRTSRSISDEIGRTIRLEAPGAHPVDLLYDSRGRLATISQGDTEELRSVSFTYRPDGYLDTITDPLARTVSFDYDAAGRVIEQAIPGDRTVGFGYDANGNLTEVVPPGRPAHGFEYNAVDLATRYSPPDLGIGPVDTTYEYDLDRKLTRIERPDGKALGVEYDPAGRLSALRSPEDVALYQYDSATGRLNRIDGPAAVDLLYEYDGHLVTGTYWSGDVTGSVTRQHDLEFRTVSRCVNTTHCATFGWDNDGLLTQAGALAIEREDLTGKPSGSTLGTVTTGQSYNAFGELQSFTVSASGTPIYDYGFSRDTGGRIVQKTETIEEVTATWTYHYDPTGRLQRVEKDGVLFAEYIYDRNGNRLSYQGTFGSFTGAYDDQDRLTSYGNTTFAYTANGEVISRTQGDQSISYEYDIYGNLQAVEMPDGLSIEYVVDGQNRRVGKKVEGVLIKAWLYKDLLNPIAELDGAGNVVSRFIYGSMPNVPDYVVKGGVTYRILADHLGSVRLVLNSSTGAIVQRIDYDAFGRVLLDTDPGFQPFGFAGGLYDPQTGLVRFGARDYDPRVGRWTAKDPLPIRPWTTNLYEYASSDPINMIDVTGAEAVPGFWDFIAPAATAWCEGTRIAEGIDDQEQEVWDDYEEEMRGPNPCSRRIYRTGDDDGRGLKDKFCEAFDAYAEDRLPESKPEEDETGESWFSKLRKKTRKKIDDAADNAADKIDFAIEVLRNMRDDDD